MFGCLSLVLALVSVPSSPPPAGPGSGSSGQSNPDPLTQVDRAGEPGSKGRRLGVQSVQEVWAEAPHNAFTDLVCHGDALVLAFREGDGHVSADGALRILRSSDGESWTPSARLSLAGYDLRDADLSIAPDGRILLIGGACPRPEDGKHAPTGTVAAWSADGSTWSQPHLVVDPGRWLWRVAWSGQRAFGVSYSAGSGPPRMDLMTSLDGEAWMVRASDIHPEKASNEAALAFFTPRDEASPLCVALARSQERGVSASVGLAEAPFREFEWRPLGFTLGGPNLTRSPKGAWIAAGRVVREGAQRTAVFFLDPETGLSEGMQLLPSGGDTSYPGLAWWKGELFLSYYSSHRGEADYQPGQAAPRTRIFVARIQVEE